MPQDGLRAVNVYVIEGPDGLAMVDAGWRVPGNLELLGDALAAIGGRLSDVQDVYVTHVHRDHYTLGPELRRAAGARLHLGEGERAGIESVQALGSNQPLESLRQLRRAGAGELAATIESLMMTETWDAGDWESPDEWLRPGEISVAGRPVEAVAVPGHTKGHLVFYDRAAGHMFTGDHVLPTISPSIGFELGDWELPLGHYLESLATLMRGPDAMMLPAHGHPGRGVHDRVRELLAHHDRRLDATRALLSTSRTGLDVAQRLLWTRRERSFRDLDSFNRMIAVSETMAHLDVLVERGHAQVSYDAEVARFRAR
jgi:glyoxylase-like metal-dependent hydrolase (beta-lactamase superfamily II)